MRYTEVNLADRAGIGFRELTASVPINALGTVYDHCELDGLLLLHVG